MRSLRQCNLHFMGPETKQEDNESIAHKILACFYEFYLWRAPETNINCIRLWHHWSFSPPKFCISRFVLEAQTKLVSLQKNCEPFNNTHVQKNCLKHLFTSKPRRAWWGSNNRHSNKPAVFIDKESRTMNINRLVLVRFLYILNTRWFRENIPRMPSTWGWMLTATILATSLRTGSCWML